MAISLPLIQFVFRLTFGVALAMGITPARHVSSGFYRVHLWVLLGLNTFAALTVFTLREELAEPFISWQVVFGLACALIGLSYFGAVAWLYEKSQLGHGIILLVAAVALAASALATPWENVETVVGTTLALLDLISSGMLLGVTLAAMLLGHWYLNTPTMELLPLRRLVLFMVGSIAVRTFVSGSGLTLQLTANESLETTFWIFVVFRWLAGLVGTCILAILTWYTLRIPNTQSATGILYAGVILTFLGELTSQLLSVNALYPL